MPDSLSTDLRTALRSQYGAALDMWEEAVSRCPDRYWADTAAPNPFWHVAYHALFYVHLYLQPTEAEFEAWSGHRPNLNFMGRLPWPPHEPIEVGEPYTKADLMDYLALCRTELARQIPAVDLDAASGFDWIQTFGKLELQLYNLRHLQHHVGELSTMLHLRDGTEVPWVGKKHDGDDPG